MHDNLAIFLAISGNTDVKWQQIAALNSKSGLKADSAQSSKDSNKNSDFYHSKMSSVGSNWI